MLGLLQAAPPWSLVRLGLGMGRLGPLVGRGRVLAVLLGVLGGAALAAAATLAAMRGGNQHVVEAGQADVQQHATLDVKLVVEVVELLCDVVAQHDGEEPGDVAVLGYQHVEAPATP